MITEIISMGKDDEFSNLGKLIDQVVVIDFTLAAFKKKYLLYMNKDAKKDLERMERAITKMKIIIKKQKNMKRLKKEPIPMINHTAIVVDDDKNTVKVFSDLLEMLGLRVLGKGYDGNDAVLLYKKCRPYVIFVDVMMPQFDGLYALEKIREFDPDAKVVAVTGDTTPETIQRLEKMKVSAIVFKPFNTEEIKKTLAIELKILNNNS